jgi:hypothetical protein
VSSRELGGTIKMRPALEIGSATWSVLAGNCVPLSGLQWAYMSFKAAAMALQLLPLPALHARSNALHAVAAWGLNIVMHLFS